MTLPASWLENVAQRLGASASAATIFGTPIERGDTTVVPIAKATYGFGGGGGTRSGEGGSGGGGAISVTPVGYLEIRPGAVRYRPIRDWAWLAPALVVGAVAALVTRRRFVRRRSDG